MLGVIDNKLNNKLCENYNVFIIFYASQMEYFMHIFLPQKYYSSLTTININFDYTFIFGHILFMFFLLRNKI